MDKKKLIIIISAITLIVLLAIAIIYVSYGYVTSDIIDNDGKGKYYVVENLRIEFSGGTETLTGNQEEVFIPGSVLTKTFSVKNTGNKEINYNIILTEIVNTFNRKNDITYELYKDETLLSSGVYPSSEISYIVGDINIDNIIDNEDYEKLQNFFDNKGTLTKMQMIRADLNLDSTVDENDLPTLIKEYVDANTSINLESDIEVENAESENIETNIGQIKTTANIETILDNQHLSVNESVTYILKINYLTSEENQIEDSGKTINAKISFETN